MPVTQTITGETMTAEQTETMEEDPFIATEKRLLQLEKQVETLNKAVAEKDKMINTVVKTNKQLLAEMNSQPIITQQKPKVSVEQSIEEAFYKNLGIKKEK